MIYETKLLFSLSSVGFFLLAYFLFNDAILTASNNFPIFLEQVWHVSDTTKTYILLGILITSAIGGTLSGYIADKLGHKRTLIFILTGYIFILPFLVTMTKNFSLRASESFNLAMGTSESTFSSSETSKKFIKPRPLATRVPSGISYT